MLPTEDLFVYVYVLIDDLVTARIFAIPPRPGPAPGCSDAELLTIATTRHVLGRRSEAGFLAEVARDWAHLFPRLPHQSEATAASAGCGARSSSCAATSPGKSRPMTASRSIPARCRSSTPRESAAPTLGPALTGCTPGSAATPAHAEWFYGFRLAIKTDLGSRIIRAWSIVPAAINERDVAGDLLETGPPPRDLRPAARRRRLVRDALRRDPEDRWAAVFGRIAGYSFAVAVVTGVLLLPFFRPSMATLAYHGSYRLLDGVTMSRAYRPCWPPASTCAAGC